MRKNFIFRLCLALAILPGVLLFSLPGHTAVLRDMYVNASSPLFAEIPVCADLPNELLSEYDIQIVGNEEFDDNGKQPFIDNLAYRIDTLNELEGILTVTSELELPSNLQLIVTLADKNGNSVDSQIYTNLETTSQTPDPGNFGCEQFQVVIENVVEDTPALPPEAPDLPFTIDIVNRDTWRNIAVLVNASWYNNAYSVEQVMAALYLHNIARPASVTVPNGGYSLPEQLEVPITDVPSSINATAAISLAKLLDGSGSFKVERVAKGPSKTETEITDLREELAELREQINLLTQQLTDSNKLIEIRNEEVQDLQNSLLETRKRIAELESTNLELQDSMRITSQLRAGLMTPWPWLALLILIALFTVYSINSRQRREDYTRLMRQIKHSEDSFMSEKKN